MATDGSTMSNRQECERCGKIVRSSQALYEHLHDGSCRGRRSKGVTGVVMMTDAGATEVQPHRPSDMYID